MDVTALERIALMGLQARDREIFTQYVQPLQSDIAQVFRAIEERLGLPSESIGTTHQVDMERGVVSLIEPVAPPEQVMRGKNGRAVSEAELRP